MTEFTAEWIAQQRKYVTEHGTLNDQLCLELLDEIEQQAKRIEELEIKKHINLDADMMITMADNSKGYIDMIIELQARIKELEQERQWIPTSERLPKDDGYYYVAFLISGKKYMTDIYYFKSNSVFKWYRDNVHFDVATFYDMVAYWTTRPQPPKDAE